MQNIQDSYALTLGMSSEQILKTQDIVILGHIESVDLKSNQTEFGGIKVNDVGPRGESNPCPGIHSPLY